MGDVTKRLPKNKKRSFDLMTLFFIIYSFILIGYMFQILIINSVSFGSPGSVFYLEFNDTGEVFPVDILINGLFMFSLLYIGGEGAHSMLKSAKAPEGDFASVPEWKLKRFRIFLAAWFILTFGTMLMVYIGLGSVSEFFIRDIFTAMVGTVVSYGYARKAKSIGPVHVGKDIDKKPPTKK